MKLPSPRRREIRKLTGHSLPLNLTSIAPALLGEPFSLGIYNIIVIFHNRNKILISRIVDLTNILMIVNV